MFEWLEKRIDPFAPFNEEETPPGTVAAFAWHYLRPVRLLARGAVRGLAASSAFSRPRLYVIMGWLVDILAQSTPDRLWSDHGTSLLLAGGAILFVRPILHFAHEVLTNQILVPQSTNMIRWRTHLYTLGHAVGYFQARFRRAARRTASRRAGRRSAKSPSTVLDTLLYVAIFAFTALGLFSRVSPWLALPMGLWIAAYMALLRYFVPRAKMRSLRVADTRSALVGRVVDSYTNILTVKLFARGAEERSAVREAIAAAHAGLPQLVPADHRRRLRADGHEQLPCSSRPALCPSCSGCGAR